MIIGRFVGKDSMGFKHGNLYYLKSKTENIYLNGKNTPCICLYDTKSKAWCPYQTLEGLLENWEIIEN